MTDEDDNKFSLKEFAASLKEDIEQNRIKLPTLPAISLEALVVVNDADSRMEDVARIINKDAAMAARLVRYSNSPLYLGLVAVTTVRSAITRIGFDTVKHAILTLSMKDVFTTGYSSIQKRMESLWRHSVEVASRSAVMAERFPHLNTDEAMLAGLIHDIGVIPILLKAVEDDRLTSDNELLDKVISALHMYVGKIMLTLWKFDPRLIEVAAAHDQLNREPIDGQVDYVDIVQVANILSYEGTDHPYAQIDRSKIKAFERVGINPLEGKAEREDDEEVFIELKSLLY